LTKTEVEKLFESCRCFNSLLDAKKILVLIKRKDLLKKCEMIMKEDA
jgi:hypothetical protein